MSDLMDFIYFIIVYPFLSVLLSELLNVLCKLIFTMLRIFSGCPQATPGDTQYRREISEQESFGERVANLFEDLKYVWSLIAAILYCFNSRLQHNPVIWDSVDSDDAIQQGNGRTPASGDGLNESQDVEGFSSSVPYTSRPKSGRHNDVLSNSVVETDTGENIQNISSASVRFGSHCKRMRRPDNWFGDRYRMRREERLPNDVQKFGRPASFFTNSASPFFVEVSQAFTTRHRTA